MPVVGRNRKAKPYDVIKNYPAESDAPRPRRHETFRDYLARLLTCYSSTPGGHDWLLTMIMAEGFDEPNQNEYLYRLDQLNEILFKVRENLKNYWPRR